MKINERKNIMEKRPGYLSQDAMERLHEGSLRLLENKGVVFQSEAACELFRRNGARVDGETAYIPRALVEACLKQVPPAFKLTAVNDRRSVTVGEGLAIHPAGGEVFILTADGQRREGVLRDYANFQKVYQSCDNIDMTGYQPGYASDKPPGIRGLCCLKETMAYTDKPWLAPMDYVGGKEKERIMDMYGVVLGDGFLKDNYVTWNVVCPESPLKYDRKSCESMISFSEYNQPTALVSAPMSGITSPVFPYASVLLQNTEALAGICLVQLIKPGIPVLPSASLTYGNLKLATWECACPDSALMLSAAVQMYREFYKLPARAQTGVTSSKSIDYQAGFETMQSLLLTALMGVNVTSQSVGTLENLLTVSLEKTLIDDEIISRVRRIASGFDTSEEALGIKIIEDTPHGKDFLTHDSTLDHYKEGWSESISDWNRYEHWARLPERDIVPRAAAKVQEIIDSAPVLLSVGAIGDLDRYISKCSL